MPWYVWLLVLDLAFGAVWKVATVGRPRDPITPTDAAVAVVVTTAYLVPFLIWAL